jgi:hypothetical protein
MLAPNQGPGSERPSPSFRGVTPEEPPSKSGHGRCFGVTKLGINPPQGGVGGGNALDVGCNVLFIPGNEGTEFGCKNLPDTRFPRPGASFRSD